MAAEIDGGEQAEAFEVISLCDHAGVELAIIEPRFWCDSYSSAIGRRVGESSDQRRP